ncbi:MAG: response regulator [bacterium]
MKALLIEDNPDDVLLLREYLRTADGNRFTLESAEDLASGLDCLSRGGIDVVLLDLSLPDSCGLETFVSVHERAPMAPILLLTGLDDEDLAIKAVQMGAQDYLVKGRVDGNLLIRAMRYAIERNKLLHELKEALAKIKTLRGLIPICAWCRKIRDDEGYWNMIETYISKHTEANFTHGICPECMAKLKENPLEEE